MKVIKVIPTYFRGMRSSELKRLDRQCMSVKFESKVLPVQETIWYRYRFPSVGVYLSRGEVTAFLKGMNYVTEQRSMERVGYGKAVYAALYQYYKQSDSVVNSARKADETSKKLFKCLAWTERGINGEDVDTDSEKGGKDEN